jgi:hypothetical protein
MLIKRITIFYEHYQPTCESMTKKSRSSMILKYKPGCFWPWDMRVTNKKIVFLFFFKLYPKVSDVLTNRLICPSYISCSYDLGLLLKKVNSSPRFIFANQKIFSKQFI